MVTLMVTLIDHAFRYSVSICEHTECLSCIPLFFVPSRISHRSVTYYRFIFL
jgi:hypothetical protein